MNTVAKGEYEREARRILPRLAGEGCHLVPVEGSDQWGLRTPRRRAGVPRIRVPGPVVARLERETLLHRRPDNTLVLSETGAAWLARRAGGNEAFRRQHSIEGEKWVPGRGPSDTAPARLRANLAESPLGWLRRRRGPDGAALISDLQFEAGERLRADFTLAQMMPRTTADWSMPLAGQRRAAGDALTPGETALAARERFQRALQAVGPGLADPLVDVCCYLKGLEQAEREYGWPRRTGKVVLAIALDRLVLHYGLASGTGRARPRGWRAQADPAAPE